MKNMLKKLGTLTPVSYTHLDVYKRQALGQSIALKDFYTGKKDLTGLLGSLLSGILTQDEENVLLSLTGISPSVLAGNEITGSLTVKANDKYAGGMVGQGDGVKIISSSDLEAKSYVWKNVIDELNYTVLGRDVYKRQNQDRR